LFFTLKDQSLGDMLFILQKELLGCFRGFVCRSLKFLLMLYILRAIHCEACEVPLKRTKTVLEAAAGAVDCLLAISATDPIPEEGSKKVYAAFGEYMLGNDPWNFITDMRLRDASTFQLILRSFVVARMLWETQPDCVVYFLDWWKALLVSALNDSNPLYSVGYYLCLESEFDELFDAFAVFEEGKQHEEVSRFWDGYEEFLIDTAGST
jgi:hypothetical protein